MEQVKEVREGERSGTLQSSAAGARAPCTLAVATLRAWNGFTPALAVWSVYQLEALLHPSVPLVDVCWRLLFVCLVWIPVAGCIHALKCCLQPGQRRMKGEPPETEQQIVTEIRNEQRSQMLQPTNAGVSVNVVVALADGLLLCVLQEPLQECSVPQIHALRCRLESVSQTLEKADVGSEEEMNQSSTVADQLKVLRAYLQQRIVSLRALAQVQGNFEASVKNMLQGLDDLWAQLEELHTGVTLSKQESQGHRDLASAHTDAQRLWSVLGHRRNELKSCQVHLKDSTQLLQELTWSHTQLSRSVSSGSESVWAELLLQSNIEQFDRVQESFLSLEQQTSNFQAHLEGLREKHAGPVTPADSGLPQTSIHVLGKASPEPRNSTSSSTSSSTSVDAGRATDTDNSFSPCPRSARPFSSIIGRLRKSGRKK